MTAYQSGRSARQKVGNVSGGQWEAPKGAWPTVKRILDPGGIFSSAQKVNFKPQTSDIQADSFLVPNQQASQQNMGAAAAQAAQRGGPTAVAVTPSEYGGAQIATGNEQQVRGQQQALVGALQARVSGEAPSLAAMQAQQASQRAIAAARANAASAAGVNPALALRMAGEQISQSGIAAGQTAAQATLAEQQQAQQALVGALQGVRGQDIAQAQAQAQLQQQAGLQTQQLGTQANLQQSLANQDAELKQRQMNDQLVQFYTQAGLSLDQAQLQANIELEKLRAQDLQAAQALQVQIGMANQQAAQQKQGGILSGAGAISGLLSDRRAKADIESGDKDVGAFLDALKAKRYRYSAEEGKRAHGDGEQFGIIAQDAAKTRVGRSLISPHKGTGYMGLDPVRGFGVVLAALAKHQKQLKRLEAR